MSACLHGSHFVDWFKKSYFNIFSWDIVSHDSLHIHKELMHMMMMMTKMMIVYDNIDDLSVLVMHIAS